MYMYVYKQMYTYRTYRNISEAIPYANKM